MCRSLTSTGRLTPSSQAVVGATGETWEVEKKEPAVQFPGQIFRTPRGSRAFGTHGKFMEVASSRTSPHSPLFYSSGVSEKFGFCFFGAFLGLHFIF